jgi:hypothetical protein
LPLKRQPLCSCQILLPGERQVNRDQVLLHLKEARDALDRTIIEIRATTDYGYGEYWVEMQHIYHHLNTAWNSRDATPDQIASLTDSGFNDWSQFPRDLPMMKV